MNVQHIITSDAKLLGACELADNIKDYRDLVSRIFLRNGTPFCIKHRFPKYSHFRLVKPYCKNDDRVYIDAGEVTIADCDNVLLVGKTKANITCNERNSVHKILCYHGASAHIKVDNAVVRIYKVDAGEITTEKIGKSIILKDVTPENIEL